jgi:hypothetical protein
MSQQFGSIVKSGTGPLSSWRKPGPITPGRSCRAPLSPPSCPGLTRLPGRSPFGEAKARASTPFLSLQRRGWPGQARPGRVGLAISRPTIACGYGSRPLPTTAVRVASGGETYVLVLAAQFARVLNHVSPSKIGGRRESRVAACTRGPRAKKNCASAKTTGTGGDNRPSPRDGLRLIRALLGEPADCHRRPREAFQLRWDSAPAWARQDHMTSPSAPVPLISRHQPVHRIPHHVRDDAYAPCRCGTRAANHKF